MSVTPVETVEPLDDSGNEIGTLERGECLKWGEYYGFVSCDGREIEGGVFVHWKHIASGGGAYRRLVPGDRVRYRLVKTSKGWQARNVEITSYQGR